MVRPMDQQQHSGRPPAPTDGEEPDAIDRLGTRIGRTLGLVISLALIAGLLVFLAGRGGG